MDLEVHRQWLCQITVTAQDVAQGASGAAGAFPRDGCIHCEAAGAATDAGCSIAVFGPQGKDGDGECGTVVAADVARKACRQDQFVAAGGCERRAWVKADLLAIDPEPLQVVGGDRLHEGARVCV